MNLKQFLLCMLTLLGSMTASAYDFYVDGIYYNFIPGGSDVMVTYAEYDSDNNGDFYNGDITIPKSVFYNGSSHTVKRIGYFAFCRCTNLTSVTIPSSVTLIDEVAFYGCSGLTSITIPNSVTSIEDQAFKCCSGLSSVTIPNSVTSIGSDAFAWTAWYDNQSEGVVYAGKVAYKYKGEMPANTIIVLDEGTLGIGRFAFQNCSGLTSIDIPNSVASIGRCAFEACSGLTSVTISNSVTSIEWGAFKNCSGLTSVISEIEEPFAFGSSAFYGISSTCTLTVPAGTRDAYIAAGWTENVFKGGVVEAAAPIHNITFADATVKALCVANWDTNDDGELSEAEAAAVTDLGEVFKENRNITSFDELQYFTGLTSIGTAFYRCYGLTSIMIPNSVTSIGGWSFSYCSGLTSITIPSSVTSIGEGAFHSCSGLTSITIGSSVTSIGGSAFKNCSGLTSVTIPNSVTSIGSSAFDGCSGLTSVTIPNSVTSIGSCAFRGCSGLTSIVVEEGNAVYDSREGCNAIIKTNVNKLIAGCKNTTIPNSVTSIEKSAFQNCRGLTAITIPNSVTSIGMWAFKNCSGLISITIPNSVTTIDYTAFQICSGLTSIVVEAGNSVYDSREGCNAIIKTSNNELIVGCKNTTIPNSVTSIGWGAFYYCSGLTSITIPNSVTTIGDYAFSGCSDLASVTVQRETPVVITENVFTNRANATLFVPAGSKAAYEAADYWKEFGTIVDSGDLISLVVNGDLEGDDASCFFSIENFSEDNTVVPSTIVDGAGVGGSRGIVIHSIDNPSAVWSTQFFLRLTQTIPAGTKYHISFDYKASQAASGSTQTHAEPSSYIHYDGIGTINYTTEWKHFEHVGTFSETQSPTDNPMRTIAFFLSEIATATTYYFDNFVFEIDQSHYTGDIDLYFKDENVKALCLANWDTNQNGKLSEAEAAAVTNLGEVFKGNTTITSFDELQYFTGLTSIGDRAFYGCSGLTSITIPNSVTSIGQGAFDACSGLTSITIPNSVTSIGDYAFYFCI